MSKGNNSHSHQYTTLQMDETNFLFLLAMVYLDPNSKGGFLLPATTPLLFTVFKALPSLMTFSVAIFPDPTRKGTY